MSHQFDLFYIYTCITLSASTYRYHYHLGHTEPRHKTDEIAVLFLRTFTPVDTYTSDYGIVDGEQAFTKETSMQTLVNYKEIKARVNIEQVLDHYGVLGN